MVIWVLLKVALMQASPCITVFFSFFLVDFFLATFFLAIIVGFPFLPTSAFCEFQPYAAPFECEHWYGFSDREREALDDDATLDNS